MATSKTHTLKVKVAFPQRVGEYDEISIELSFRLPQWALTELNKIDGVAVRAARQNHILVVITPNWTAYRAAVLRLITVANSNALVEKTSCGGPGYNVSVEEQVLMTRRTDLTPASPILLATP